MSKKRNKIWQNQHLRPGIQKDPAIRRELPRYIPPMKEDTTAQDALQKHIKDTQSMELDLLIQPTSIRREGGSPPAQAVEEKSPQHIGAIMQRVVIPPLQPQPEPASIKEDGVAVLVPVEQYRYILRYIEGLERENQQLKDALGE